MTAQTSPQTSTYVATSGAAYQRFLGRWTESLAREFASFAPPAGGGPLLDAGCGTGSLALELARRFPDRAVHGVDVAQPYVDYANARASEGRPIFAKASATDLPFSDATFAASYAQLVINFIPQPQQALSEMIRVTKPGGAVSATIWDFRGGLVYQRLFWDAASGVDPGAGAARDKHFSTPLAKLDPLLALWRQSPLRDVRFASLHTRMDYASFDDYWEPLTGGQGPVGVYIDALAPALRDNIRDHVRQAYLAGDPDGPRSMVATAWAVSGLRPQD
ncbi:MULTISPECIES: class I SAM-dependent methyltransferase [unclassified Beijerinckia]|uniref:class I SAM-dependent methyltransferase n=1 Tax=unclassified Beijerinckia TaxID=2638183 RepID=UPI000896F26A|nr:MULTISPECIES: class I SAM-dependent methyltransferase [unclassified Beijerinckia]MDH7796516.1 SAM-dependent methyltransferase [Beijerinckia sp. GAS462]SEC48451.1 Methyltransferase domain-containing protein [Beijerinckia sp. 28-YEA-48]